MDVIKPYKYYAKNDLETMATQLRLEVEKSRKKRISAKYIDKAIANYLDINYEWDSMVSDRQGNIAAMIIPIKKLNLNKEKCLISKNT